MGEGRGLWTQLNHNGRLHHHTNTQGHAGSDEAPREASPATSYSGHERGLSQTGGAWRGVAGRGGRGGAGRGYTLRPLPA